MVTVVTVGLRVTMMTVTVGPLVDDPEVLSVPQPTLALLTELVPDDGNFSLLCDVPLISLVSVFLYGDSLSSSRTPVDALYFFFSLLLLILEGLLTSLMLLVGRDLLSYLWQIAG